MAEKLSVVVITYNEEHNLGRCLNSLRDLADEIVVVDSLSTDNTRGVAEGYPNARFITQAFLGYGPQKNFAVAQTQNEIVLSLDADEALSEDLYAAIKQALQNFTADGYTMNRLTWYHNRWIRHSGWYPDKKLRLWRKSKGRFCDKQLHESLEMQPDSCVAHLNGDLLHYSYASIAHHIAQFNQYSDTAAKAAFAKKRKVNMLADIVVNPFLTFLKKYFIQLGFLDGYVGFAIAIHTSYGKFVKYAKLKELYEQNKSNK